MGCRGRPATLRLAAKANFWWTAITSTGCALFRRSLIDEVGEFDEAISQAEDCEFWLRCGVTCPFAHCDTVVLKKYETPGSLGSQRRRQHLVALALAAKVSRLVRRAIG